MQTRLLIIFALIILTDFYAFKGVKAVFPDNNFVIWTYWLLSIVTYSGFGLLFYNFATKPGVSILSHNLLMGAGFGFFVTKLLFCIFVLVNDIYGLGVFSINQVVGTDLTRRKFILQAGLAITAIPFAGFLYGIYKGKYNYKVVKQTIKFPDLPEAFNGFKILQISDIHSGSFDDKAEVEKGIELIQKQNADVICFTGDLVNNKAAEIEPYIGLFGQLSAPFGMYSCLGNHDYGDYVPWRSQQAKMDNLEVLKQHHRSIGFKLLNNDSVKIEKSRQSINICGVENWGLPPFPQHGDINKAFANTTSNDFNILLSHDPSHWKAEVVDFEKQVHLTLSGHTHGMQFGIDIPGIKWSPVKYKYPQWSGLYSNKNQHLYVNKGFGFLGFPGRVGMWPEITVIELKRG